MVASHISAALEMISYFHQPSLCVRGTNRYDAQGCNRSECILLTFPVFGAMIEASISEYLEDGMMMENFLDSHM